MAAGHVSENTLLASSNQSHKKVAKKMSRNVFKNESKTLSSCNGTACSTAIVVNKIEIQMTLI